MSGDDERPKRPISLEEAVEREVQRRIEEAGREQSTPPDERDRVERVREPGETAGLEPGPERGKQ